jgi:lipocalin
MPVLERAEEEMPRSLQKELLKYPGRWVAISRTAIIAIGDSAEDVLAKAREEGYASAELYRVPEGEFSYYF